ncbi:hypothetical protein ACLMJK_000692 [Lecanora helva]
MAPLISNPRRLLIIGPPDTPHPHFLKGLSYHEIQTPYYSASIPIWSDTLPLAAPAIRKFQDEWSSSEAAEVVQAIGAWMVCFKKPRERTDVEAIQSLLTAINSIIERHDQSSYTTSEPLLLAVGMQQSIVPSLEMNSDEWDNLCRECGGWEWIDGELAVGGDYQEQDEGQEQRNEFGERVGISRLKEALEAHEWEGNDIDSGSDDLNFGSEDGPGAEASQMEEEMAGLKVAVQEEHESEEGGDDEVEQLETMMLKVQAIKEMGADMPEAERKRFAAAAVKDVMKRM